MGVPVPAQPAGTTRRPPAAPAVRVNRTVPRVKPPASGVHFSAQPTVAEVLQARVFAEPLVPVGGVPSDVETRALAGAITHYRHANRMDEVGPLRTSSSGFANRRGGRRCKATWGASCGRAAPSAAPSPRGMTPGGLANAVDTPHGRAVAGDAVGSAVEALATLGKPEAIEARLRAIAERTFSGRATAQLRQARLALAERRAHPDDVIPSGTQAVLVVTPRGAASSPAWRCRARRGGRPDVGRRWKLKRGAIIWRSPGACGLEVRRCRCRPSCISTSPTTRPSSMPRRLVSAPRSRPRRRPLDPGRRTGRGRVRLRAGASDKYQPAGLRSATPTGRRSSGTRAALAAPATASRRPAPESARAAGEEAAAGTAGAAAAVARPLRVAAPPAPCPQPPSSPRAPA